MAEMRNEDATGMWAVVEVMGHRRYAGRVTEHQLAGCGFVRIDIPEANGVRAFTKMFGTSSIYAITPTTEEAARKLAAQIGDMPPDEMLRRLIPSGQLSLGEAGDEHMDDGDDYAETLGDDLEQDD